MLTNHPNSKKVTIYRTSTLMEQAQEKDAPEYEEMATKYVGPYMIFNSKLPGCGMLNWEIDLLLPHLIFTDRTDKMFREEVRKFYDSLRTSIPYKGGREYEVGLEIDNNQKMSEDNMPIDIMEYVRFKHATGSPNVAKSKEEYNGNQNVWFYISDPITETAKIHAASAAKDEAQAIYLGLKGDVGKVDMYLTITGADPRKYGSLGDKQIALREALEKNPGEFLKAHKIDNFELRYKIQSFINTGVFTLVNNSQIIDTESRQLIGNNMNEAIAAVQKPEFEPNMVSWLIRMQEGLKKSLVPRKRVTTGR